MRKESLLLTDMRYINGQVESLPLTDMWYINGRVVSLPLTNMRYINGWVVSIILHGIGGGFFCKRGGIYEENRILYYKRFLF